MSTSLPALPPARGWRRALVLALPLACAAGAACAQALPDPTRPPAALSAPAAAEGAAPSLPQLQSILVGRAPGGRRVAVIDGETVRLGESFHGARLVRVTDDEVTLARGRERQTLRLYAQGDKAAAAAPH